MPCASVLKRTHPAPLSSPASSRRQMQHNSETETRSHKYTCTRVAVAFAMSTRSQQKKCSRTTRSSLEPLDGHVLPPHAAAAVPETTVSDLDTGSGLAWHTCCSERTVGKTKELPFYENHRMYSLNYMVTVSWIFKILKENFRSNRRKSKNQI